MEDSLNQPRAESMEEEGRRRETFDFAFCSYTQDERKINNEGDVIDKMIPRSTCIT